MKNSRYVPLSQEILMLIALVGGKMILLTLQAKKLTLISSTGYAQIIDKPNHVVNNSMSCIDLYILYKQKYNFKSWSWCYDFWEMSS